MRELPALAGSLTNLALDIREQYLSKGYYVVLIPIKGIPEYAGRGRKIVTILLRQKGPKVSLIIKCFE